MRNPRIRTTDPGQIACTRSRSLKKRIPTASVKGISTCFTASTKAARERTYPRLPKIVEAAPKKPRAENRPI